MKEIVTEIESIHQGAGQGQTKVDSLNNPVLTPKRNTVHDLPTDPVWAWEKSGKVELGEGFGLISKEISREPVKPDQESALVPQVPSSKLEEEESSDLAEDPPETRLNPGPKWCPGSVRRATLEFEERLRQEQELQHASPNAMLPTRKNSKNESIPADLCAKGKNEEPPPESLAQLSKEALKAGNSGTGAGSEQPANLLSSPLPGISLVESSTELAVLAREHRTVVSLESHEKISAPCLLPKRIEIIEYIPSIRLPVLSGAEVTPPADRSPPLEKPELGAAVPPPVVDENCNTSLCPEDPCNLGGALPLSRPSVLEHRDVKKAIFCLGSPEEEAEGALTNTSTSLLVSQVGSSSLPCLDHRHLVGLKGVTQDSTSTDPEPPLAGGYAGNGQFAFEERGGAPRRSSEGTLPCWIQEEYNSPNKFGTDALGGLEVAAAPASSLCCGLPHSSSSNSIKDLSRGAGLVKERTKEMEARIRQAGLTPPSQMKRSASLAKLGCLDLSKDDLPSRDTLSSSANLASLESLQATLGQEEHQTTLEHRLGDPATAPYPASSLPALEAPQPMVHFVEQLKMTECIALSKPVERPPVQYAKEFCLAQPLLEAKLTSTPAAELSGLAQRLAVVPRYQHGRTRPPRRLKKANDRKRTTNPLYNTM